VITSKGMGLRRDVCTFAHVVALSTVAISGWSQEARPANRAEAAARFEEGKSAFDAGDFRRAAESFEAAYRLAPNADVLWNAARAWQRAGEAAHAATLYSRYLRDAPPAAADRGTATAQLAALSPKLARIEVHGDAIAELRLDDAASEDRVLYVSRGTHVVSATVGGKPVRRKAQVEAGDVVSVVFEPEGSETGVSASLPNSARNVVPPAEVGERTGRGTSSHKTWSPWVFVGGAAFTSVVLGFTIASGVDTDNALNAFDAKSTPSLLSSGQAKQLRTNILLGSSIALGAATAAVGIWLVDWHSGGQRVQVGFEPPRGAVRWSF
jgi:tetratricopeptide (TPR) repeat protein